MIELEDILCCVRELDIAQLHKRLKELNRSDNEMDFHISCIMKLLIDYSCQVSTGVYQNDKTI